MDAAAVTLVVFVRCVRLLAKTLSLFQIRNLLLCNLIERYPEQLPIHVLFAAFMFSHN